MRRAVTRGSPAWSTGLSPSYRTGKGGTRTGSPTTWRPTARGTTIEPQRRARRSDRPPSVVRLVRQRQQGAVLARVAVGEHLSERAARKGRAHPTRFFRADALRPVIATDMPAVALLQRRTQQLKPLRMGPAFDVDVEPAGYRDDPVAARVMPGDALQRLRTQHARKEPFAELGAASLELRDRNAAEAEPAAPHSRLTPELSRATRRRRLGRIVSYRSSSERSANSE